MGTRGIDFLGMGGRTALLSAIALSVSVLLAPARHRTTHALHSSCTTARHLACARVVPVRPLARSGQHSCCCFLLLARCGISRHLYGVPMVRHPTASVAARALVYASTPIRLHLTRAAGLWCGARRWAGAVDWGKTAPRPYDGRSQATTLLFGGAGRVTGAASGLARRVGAGRVA
jgi:hypothetical protein